MHSSGRLLEAQVLTWACSSKASSGPRGFSMLAELKVEEQRFGASLWADFDTLFHPPIH